MSSYNLSGATKNTGKRGNIFDNDRSRSDFGSSSDLNRAQYLAPWSDHDTFPHCRVTFATLFSCPAQCHVLKENNVIFYDGCFSNDNAGSMIENDTCSQSGCGVYVNVTEFRCHALQKARGCLSLFVP